MNIKHSKGDPNWMTPGEGQRINYLAKIRECLGGQIGFDPFSSHVANQYVQAVSYFTPAENGFFQDWKDDAHINPPGLQVKEAWVKLCAEVMAGRVSRAMWTGFSVEQLCILAEPNDVDNQHRWALGKFYPMDFSVVILRNRISFVKEDGTTGSPSHGNYLCGINIEPVVFEREFGPLGQIIHGPLARQGYGLE